MSGGIGEEKELPEQGHKPPEEKLAERPDEEEPDTGQTYGPDGKPVPPPAKPGKEVDTEA